MDFLSSLVSAFSSPAPAEQELEEYLGVDAQKCSRCEFGNDPGQPLCCRCGEPLPFLLNQDDDGDSELVRVPPSYQALFASCHAVASHQIEVEEWWAEVQRLAQAFTSTESYVRSQAEHLGPLLEGELAEATAGLLDGLSQALEALDLMAAYLDLDNNEILNQGWLALLRATRLIQKAGALFAARLPEETPPEETGLSA